MTNRMIVILCSSLLVGCGGDSVDVSSGGATGEASYRVTFSHRWSGTNFPIRYPSGAHFSPLTGAVHGPGVDFFELNQSASDAIEAMAETGATGQLEHVVNQAIESGTAHSVISGSGIFGSGTASTTFSVTDAYPLVTLVSMIAPSPDWFVGVDGLSFQDENGHFHNNLTIDLRVYDAGTDQGVTFTSLNSEESSVITRLTCEDLENDCGFVDGLGTQGVEYIGTFTFERIE